MPNNFRQVSEEGEDFVGGQGLQFAVFEFLAEFRNGRVVETVPEKSLKHISDNLKPIHFKEHS